MCFSHVFPFSLYIEQEFYTRYFNPITFLVNAFAYTEKGSRFSEIFKTIKFFCYAINFRNLISISFHNLHLYYL